MKRAAVKDRAANGEANKGDFLGIVRANYREWLLVSAAYLVITLVVFWPVALNVTTTIPAGGAAFVTAGNGDAYQNLWNLWWVGYSVFGLGSSPYFTHLLFYPVGASLVTHTLSPLAALFSYPFQAVSLGLAYNAVLFADFVLAALFTYILALYLVRNRPAAFIAGIVFAFSSFHMAQSLFGRVNWTSTEFLPLFVLFFLLMLRDKRPFAILGTAASFVLLFFFGDPEQGVMGVVFALLLTFVTVLSSEGRRAILSKRFIMSAFAAAVLALLIGAPFFYPIASGLLHGALGLANKQSSANDNMVWSAPLLSFFLPSPSNNLFSFTSKISSYFSVFAADSKDREAYIGYSVLALAALAVVSDIRKNRFRATSVWAILGIVFAWLALGPYLQLGALPNPVNPKNYVAGLYLLYRDIPVLNVLREPGRFDLALSLCLSVLAAFGFKELVETRLKPKNRETLYAITAVAALLILLECSGVPFSGAYVKAYFLKLGVPAGYSQLAAVPGNFSVMFLPSLQSISNRPLLYLGMQMYFQTVFQKPLISGYVSRENSTEMGPTLSIPLVLEANSLQKGGNFVYESPISENYTNVTLFFLSRYNTSFVSVINGAYGVSGSLVVHDYLTSVFGQPFYQDSKVSIYSTANAISRSANRSVVAYVSRGTWQHGCSEGMSCNSTLYKFWWGSRVRGITVFVPQNRTRLAMKFSAVPHGSNVSLSIFLNSNADRVGYVVLRQKVSLYQLNLTLNPGLDRLYFVTSNAAPLLENESYDIGIRNITFIPR